MIFFWGRKKKEDISKNLNEVWGKLKELYKFAELPEDKKTKIADEIALYGYLRLSHQEALENLSPAEALYALELKFGLNKTMQKGKFSVDEKTLHPAQRAGYTNSTWMQKEQHNIKLINLAGLGNGAKSSAPGIFVDWIKQLATLPAGNLEKGVLATTVYLIPFHPREFGCAYLPTSSDVSSFLEDSELKEKLNLNVKEQVKLFIKLSQLAGHSVIYDVLPQTGRFSKAVLANPYIARWFDVTKLTNESVLCSGKIAEELEELFETEKVKKAVSYFNSELTGTPIKIESGLKKVYGKFLERMLEKQKELSEEMLYKKPQEAIVERVKSIVAANNDKKDIQSEDDIVSQGKIIEKLIENGLWPAPGGAWCSCGAPIFVKMAENGAYPVFKHFDIDGNDVSQFANLDCQTPYYFVHWETGELNGKVVDYFVDYMKKLQKEYGFDGFRVDHIDHVVDRVSEKGGIPISYRAPRKVLGKLNEEMKKEVPTFALLAEYMLWDGFYKEYHIDMNFDLLWGNDIIAQMEKNVSAIINDNETLNNYNFSLPKERTPLSILKTYNNQDGEFGAIDQYPGQLGEQGALFKWFKYKFLPGGKYANRPALFVDGDESFTQKGIEKTIGEEVSMKRNNNDTFYAKFTAINDFALNNELTLGGEAQIVAEDDDGFVAWLISKDPLKESLLVVANQNCPTEKKRVKHEDGETSLEMVEGESVLDKLINLPCDYKIVSQYTYNNRERKYTEKDFTRKNTIKFSEIQPAEFFIYKVLR